MTQTETLTHFDDRSELRLCRRLAHPPAKVWRAVTESEQLSQWFPATVRLDPVVGSPILFDFGDGGEPAPGGTVREVDEPRRFAIVWGPDEMIFELEPDGDGCVLVFTHVLRDRSGAASFAAGWDGCLAVLAAVLDGRQAPEMGDMNQRHQDFVEQFGLVAGTVQEGPGGWEVRFERQLTQPADEVWAQLVRGGDDPEVGQLPPEGFTATHVRAGEVTVVDEPSLVEYDADGGGWVHWELATGTGHGARLILTESGPTELVERRDAALVEWQERIERLARELL